MPIYWTYEHCLLSSLAHIHTERKGLCTILSSAWRNKRRMDIIMMCTVQVDWSRRQCPVVINQVQPFTPTRNRIKAKTSCPVAFGGQLIVKHQTERKEFDFSGSDNSSYFHYAAFYADCIHEIKPVTHAHEYWMTIFNRQHYMYTCNYSQDCVSFSFWDIHTQCTEQYKTPLHSCYSVNTAIIMLPLVMGIVPLVAGWSSHWGGGFLP